MNTNFDNGGVIGIENNPTSSTAKGVWSSEAQADAKYGNTWPGPELYGFTSATFTPGTASGSSGPTLAQAQGGMTGTPTPSGWNTNTAYFSVTSGIQLWTVPLTASYRITTIGARGGSGATGVGAGARMIGTFSLTQGEKIKILVGQEGVTGNNACGGNKGGGGGGSFVTKQDNTILIIAGGGGGGSAGTWANKDASITTSGNAGGDTGAAGGTLGSGGGATNGCVSVGGGGGGYSGNGTNGGNGNGGTSFLNGGIGGSGGTANGGTAGNGGFGGGGGSSSYTGGGGGGYSGGGAGGIGSCNCGTLGPGGGGGSINNGSNQSNTAGVNTTGNGSVLIEKL